MGYKSKYTGSQIEVKLDAVDNKQNRISDLDAIRSGAALGTTALQSVPGEYVTETELNNKGYIQSIKTINGQSIIGEGDITIGGGGDTSILATKEELTTLQNEIIANEEVYAAAFNDLNERKADKAYIDETIMNAITNTINANY